MENGIIAEISKLNIPTAYAAVIDADGMRVTPGLIDVHTHGMYGLDTMDADIKTLRRYYAREGTTTFLPTTMTMSDEALLKVTEAPLGDVGANVPGYHFEGPYISEKHKGAQDASQIRNPDTEEFFAFDNVRMVTLAPELPGALEFIKAVREKTIVSIGHTDCDYDTAVSAIDAGASCLTHTFNAMPPLLHRAPGPIGAAAEREIYAQIICDGFHVAPAAVKAAYKLFGPDRLLFISDSIRPAKCKDGVYNCGGLEVTLKDGAARLADGTIAGSVASLLDCVCCAVNFGIPECDAVKMATETPARLLKLNKGRIKSGYDADLIITDNDFTLTTVIIGGKIYK